MKHDTDVIVVGGGHAGVEAADAAVRMGVSVVLVTMRADKIGEMSCNPAIGGLGKGHIVREIDAMDGVMGMAADETGIQFRLLNRKKGPAVQGPRVQSDRLAYKAFIQKALARRDNLRIVEGEVVDFLVTSGRVSGVVLADGSDVKARSTVLTTGTFLNGKIHIGSEQHDGGRVGDKSSSKLADRIKSFDLPTGRLKTGTPPRLDGRTIDWERLESQPGDNEPELFSFLSSGIKLKQVECGIAHTNARTHEIVETNIESSAMYGGHIEGVGPRYCPSIEDKISRFREKSSHQIFLEPESLSNNTIYPNGISTSLPVEVQAEFVHSIKGLENAKILQAGYAIEYDYIDPRALDHSLSVRNLEGLFFAGQINGTTGYEEAAGQGLVAGLNAALDVLGLNYFAPDRSTSYIGVMIDDLVLRGVTEPYRMFTSRAEYRLSLRADNADQRMTSVGVSIGCVSGRRMQSFEKKMRKLDTAASILSECNLSSKEGIEFGFKLNEDGKRRSGSELLAYPNITFEDLKRVWPKLAIVEPEIGLQIERDSQYSFYIDRQRDEVAALKKNESVLIPVDLDFSAISGISNELVAKLSASRPSTLGQASRIEGITPSALIAIFAYLKSTQRKKSA